MELGSKIYELRKKANLSQEHLAEKLNVTRQTISNWEIGQTSPDIFQAKEISKIFNVSLDELTDNDIKDILVEKITNTEKMSVTTMKTLKIICIIIICFLVIFLITNIYMLVIKMNNNSIEQEGSYQNYMDNIKMKKFICKLEEQEYDYIIFYDNEFNTVGTHLNLVRGNEEAKENFESFSKEIKIHDSINKDAREVIQEVEQYFKDNGGEFEEILKTTV